MSNRHFSRFHSLAAAFAVAAFAPSVAAQTSTRVSVEPQNPDPGSLITIALSLGPGDSISAASGTLSGEPLRFLRSDSVTLKAIGGVPADASDSVTARIHVTRASGAVDTMTFAVAVPHTEPPKEATLTVDQRFTRPMDEATRRRIARENALAQKVGRRSHDAGPMWSEPFIKPRDSRVTSRFGTGRMFNGAVASRHLGVDYAGAVGAPVVAANRGVVALVDTFFLAGRLVYIDHGGGVLTGYFHLSKPLVAVGDTVTRGQRIGLVGATGRVTGPHLHWTARYGALTVNPLGLIDLDVSGYSGALREP